MKTKCSLKMSCVCLAVYTTLSLWSASVYAGKCWPIASPYRPKILDYTHTVWQFRRGDNTVIARRIKLLPHGKIEGYAHPHEGSWGMKNGHLVFYHQDGRPTCIFKHAQQENGRTILSGPVLIDNRIHVLRSIHEEPSYRNYTNSIWQFRRGDNSIIAQKIKLLPKGKIEGYYHPNEDSWGIENGQLVFYHKDGRLTCIYTPSQTQDGKLILIGKVLNSSHIVHVLRELDHPQ